MQQLSVIKKQNEYCAYNSLERVFSELRGQIMFTIGRFGLLPKSDREDATKTKSSGKALFFLRPTVKSSLFVIENGRKSDFPQAKTLTTSLFDVPPFRYFVIFIFNFFMGESA